MSSSRAEFNPSLSPALQRDNALQNFSFTFSYIPAASRYLFCLKRHRPRLLRISFCNVPLSFSNADLRSDSAPLKSLSSIRLEALLIRSSTLISSGQSSLEANPENELALI